MNMPKPSRLPKEAALLPQLPLPEVGEGVGPISRRHIDIVPWDAGVGPIGRFAGLDPDKLRGGYYTPKAVADWLAQWALRTSKDSFLEPSCGDGSVLLAGVSRLLSLGAGPSEVISQARGVEVTPSEAETARARLAGLIGLACRGVVQTGDFFAWTQTSKGQQFTAVLGNPPFIRYQSFPEPARSRAMTMMERLGLHPNKLTNVWVPFVVGATEALAAGGRLALVIPAEILQVSYAAQLRAYLTERFEHVGIVTCNELFFDGAEQEVVLLLAEGALRHRIPGHHCRVAVVEAKTVDHLVASDPAALLAAADEKDVRGDGEKWLKYFLTSPEIEFMRELRQHPLVASLSRHARVDVGIVTGKNEWFVRRASEVAACRLEGLTERLVSRSAHFRGAVVSAADWSALSADDERVHLINIRRTELHPLASAAVAYISAGEEAKVHLGYKCSIRKPWFHVPSLWNPDAFLFRQIHDFPRFVRNDANATSTDTIHRVTVRGCDPNALVASTFSHLTAASAEIEGRSYGGGVLELEPTEAERLLIPTVLNVAMPLDEADIMIRQGRLRDLLKANDKRILIDALGLSESDCLRLQTIWTKLKDRRFARGKRRYAAK